MLRLARLALPILIAVAGGVLILVGHDNKSLNVQHEGNSLSGIGVGLIIVALMVWLINWMYRLSIQSNRDREREDAAREYFYEHGEWPDD